MWKIDSADLSVYYIEIFCHFPVFIKHFDCYLCVIIPSSGCDIIAVDLRLQRSSDVKQWQHTFLLEILLFLVFSMFSECTHSIVHINWVWFGEFYGVFLVYITKKFSCLCQKLFPVERGEEILGGLPGMTHFFIKQPKQQAKKEHKD